MPDLHRRALPAIRPCVRACLAGLAAVLVGSGGAPPSYVPLARGFVPSAGAELALAWGRSSAPIAVSPDEGGHAFWLRVSLAAEAWHASTAAGAPFRTWWTERP